MNVAKTASAEPALAESVGRGEVPIPITRPMTRPHRRRPRTQQPVTATRVRPEVMAVARVAIAYGTYTRIEIRSATEVIVR